MLSPTRFKSGSPNQIAAGLRAFFAIAEKWRLDEAQALALLGQPKRATFYNWKKGDVGRAADSLDLAARLSYVLGIFKSLEILHRNGDTADRWVTTPNQAFGGTSAMDRMMGGQIVDLAAVRDYLDSVRGGW
jgi:hypothetical protein